MIQRIFFQVGDQLPFQEKEELVEFLRRNIVVFAWDAYEALGLDPNFICHHLNVNTSIIPKNSHFGVHPRNIQMLLEIR